MAKRILDVQLTDAMPQDLLLPKHIAFLRKYAAKHAEQNKRGLIHSLDFLQMSGVYWCLTGLSIAKADIPESPSGGDDATPTSAENVMAFVQSCYEPSSGGYAPAPHHDPHILYTLSAVQIAALLNRMDVLDRDAVARYVRSLQLEDGSFQGDRWGEVDTRFSFCAVACLALLNRLEVIDRAATVRHVMRCWNGLDGGFGTRPGSESHAGQMYCCIGTLSILHALRAIPDLELTAWWLAERQLPSGGLNGRPEKAPDVCYSWWILSCLRILDRIHWIDAPKLQRFIFAAQEHEKGGIADRPGDVSDPFHTMLGLAGLSLLTEKKDNDSQELPLKTVNPVFCLPEEVISRLGIAPVQLLA